MKKILLVALLAASTLISMAQTDLKLNALYWVVGVPNVSVETRLSNKFTFGADIVYSPWENIKGRPYVLFQVIPEVRYYIKQAMDGFYVGGYAAFDTYKLSKYDHPATDVQHGVGIALGATVGYNLRIGRKWGMDFYLGGGWHHGWYYGVDTTTGDLYAPWNKSGEWLPYRAGVAFTFKL